MNTSKNEKIARIKQKAYTAFEEGYNDTISDDPIEGKMIYHEGIEYYATIDRYKTLRVVISETDELFLEKKQTSIRIKATDQSIENSGGPSLNENDFQQIKEKAIQVAKDCSKPRCNIWIIQHKGWDYPVEKSDDKLLVYIESIPMSLVVNLSKIGSCNND